MRQIKFRAWNGNRMYQWKESGFDDERFDLKLLPKGLFIVGVGGFKNLDIAEQLYDKVYEYMNENNVALVVVDGEIMFAPIEQKQKRKRWFNWR